ncbi:MAG: M23 family metallopeptidase [Actinomycetota bacterium]
MRPSSAAALLAALSLGLGAMTVPAWAQDDGSTSTSTPETTSSSTTTQPDVTLPAGETTTTTTAPPDPEDPGAVEELDEEPVPVVPETVPARSGDSGAHAAQAGRIVRQHLRVAKAESLRLDAAYTAAKQSVVDLESELDALESSVSRLAAGDRAAVRRVEIARRLFEARAANAVVRGGLNDFSRYVSTNDPNELAVAQTLLDSVLAADQEAVEDYLAAKAAVDVELVRTAERLVEGRIQLEAARAALLEARRASVAARFNLAVFAAGSEIVIYGFVFPVGDPHTFGDSFGAPRMTGTTYEHAHQGTDIMAPAGTPLLAAERGIITKMGTDVLGGTKIWVKGESGTYYYYAHLSAFAEGMANGLVVEAGAVIGFVGTTGNARGGSPHLHFEIHPDGGPAVNPYPLLKVVDQLAQLAKANQD